MRLLTVVFASAALLMAGNAKAQKRQGHRQKSRPAGPALACGTPLGFQVQLDRQGFSPGELDGTLGDNTHRALTAYQQAQGIEENGEANCATWDALSKEAAAEPVAAYRITDEDAGGPFSTRIPQDLPSQAQLPALYYRSIVERLAERFHASPALLQRLNPQARFAAGEEIKVPAVEPFDVSARPRRAADEGLRIEVSAETSMLQVRRADGSVVFAAPVSSGSAHDPLPAGGWTVTSVGWYPKFHYNPDLFWDADPAHSRATIPAGPNSPVGVAWIGIDVEHYGIHGTPEPSSVGHRQSHGCVRLTNWDVARLAGLVKVGTPVVFQ